MRRRLIRVAGVAVAVAAFGVAATSGGAATGAAKGDLAVSKIRNNHNPRFVGPDTVNETGTLTVISKTDPARIGPHTFSLVKKSALPKGEAQRTRCGHYKLVCKDIGDAHQVGPHDFVAETPDVENGNTGWDARVDGDQADGDSHYFSSKDEEISRIVTAGTGKLWFMCIIHPHMQGSIKVVSG